MNKILSAVQFASAVAPLLPKKDVAPRQGSVSPDDVVEHSENIRRQREHLLGS